MQKKALFFARADTLNDKSEGLVIKSTIKNLEDAIGEKPTDPEKLKRLEDEINLEKMVNWLYETKKPNYFINSWHKSDYESVAMWNMYAKNNKGVAIQTTCKKLKENISKSHCCYKEKIVNSPFIYIGDVKYITKTDLKFIDKYNIRIGEVEHSLKDMSTALSLSRMFMSLYFQKLASYDYEKEFRAIIDLTDISKENDEFDYTKIVEYDGVYIYVSLDFIEKIYVYPDAPDWVLDVVKSIVGKYGIDQEKVFRSELVSREFK